MNNYNKRLDDVLQNAYTVGQQFGMTTEELKQAVLRWVADEVIGKDESQKTESGDKNKAPWTNGRNNLRQQQRNTLAQHGYKGANQ